MPKVDLDKTNVEASLTMAMIFGSGEGPELGDDYVCQMLCAHHASDRCPYVNGRNYSSGLCEKFKEISVDIDPLIGQCIQHYPLRGLIALRASSRH